MVIDPIVEPVMTGLKVTLKVQLADAAKRPPQGTLPELEATKSPPPETLEMFTGTVAELVTFTILGVLEVPTIMLLKLTLSGENVSGALIVPFMPAPDNEITWGDSDPL